MVPGKVPRSVPRRVPEKVAGKDRWAGPRDVPWNVPRSGKVPGRSPEGPQECPEHGPRKGSREVSQDCLQECWFSIVTEGRGGARPTPSRSPPHPRRTRCRTQAGDPQPKLKPCGRDALSATPPTETQAVCETLASTRANAEPEAKLAPLDTLWKASWGPTTKAEALRAARAQRDPPNQSSSFFVRRASQHTSQRGAGSETRTLSESTGLTGQPKAEA